jgi:hypothetical protein
MFDYDEDKQLDEAGAASPEDLRKAADLVAGVGMAALGMVAPEVAGIVEHVADRAPHVTGDDLVDEILDLVTANDAGLPSSGSDPNVLGIISAGFITNALPLPASPEAAARYLTAEEFAHLAGVLGQIDARQLAALMQQILQQRFRA